MNDPGGGSAGRKWEDFVDHGDDFDAPLPNSRPRGGRGGRGGKRGGGGGGGGQGRAISISKALSKILRHDAVKEGLQLDGEGYAKVDELVSLCSFGGFMACHNAGLCASIFLSLHGVSKIHSLFCLIFGCPFVKNPFVTFLKAHCRGLFAVENCPSKHWDQHEKRRRPQEG